MNLLTGQPPLPHLGSALHRQIIMASIHQFITAQDLFDPDDTAAVCEAFDRACRELDDTGQPDVRQGSHREAGDRDC